MAIYHAYGAASLLAELDLRIARQFPEHPFASGVDRSNFEDVIAHYLAMSMAFPYLQAGAIHENYRRAVRCPSNRRRNMEITAAVGSFLLWDEFGGYALAREGGDAALRHLIHADRNVHSNILRTDIALLLGHSVAPDLSEPTATYLDELLDGLSDARKNRNVATMVAFEKHADEMIRALWRATCRAFGVPQDATLQYFYLHVGGENPAESFHVELTRKMIRELVPDDDEEQFLDDCLYAYRLNFQWCADVVSWASMPVQEWSYSGSAS